MKLEYLTREKYGGISGVVKRLLSGNSQIKFGLYEYMATISLFTVYERIWYDLQTDTIQPLLKATIGLLLIISKIKLLN